MKTNQPSDPPAHISADYSAKLRSGISCLRKNIQALYEKSYPGQQDWIERAVADAEASAWATPFPSLFFPPLAEARLHSALGMSAIATA